MLQFSQFCLYQGCCVVPCNSQGIIYIIIIIFRKNVKRLGHGIIS